jgi:hypothetical protein
MLTYSILVTLTKYDYTFIRNKNWLQHNIKQLGFSGLLAFYFQTNFSNGGYRRAPKTQPFHIVKRCV